MSRDCVMDWTHADEPELIRQAGQGKQDAFNELWTRYQKAILGCIKARIRPGADAKTIAAEILHETYIALSRAVQRSYDPNLGPFLPFARGYAVKLVSRHFTGRGNIISRDPQDDTMRRWETTVPDPSPSAEEQLIEAETKRRLLWVTGHCSSPPHQVVTFGLNKLLAWKPHDLVAQLSDDMLRVLETRLEHDVTTAWLCAEHVVTESFQPLRDSMHAPLSAVVPHPKAREAVQHLLHRITGDIVLHECYTRGDDPEDNVAKWSNNVWKSVRVRMLEDALGPFPGEPLREKPSIDT